MGCSRLRVREDLPVRKGCVGEPAGDVASRAEDSFKPAAHLGG